MVKTIVFNGEKRTFEVQPCKMGVDDLGEYQSCVGCAADHGFGSDLCLTLGNCSDIIYVEVPNPKETT